jgi:hypothetical protein
MQIGVVRFFIAVALVGFSLIATTANSRKFAGQHTGPWPVVESERPGLLPIPFTVSEPVNSIAVIHSTAMNPGVPLANRWQVMPGKALSLPKECKLLNTCVDIGTGPNTLVSYYSDRLPSLFPPSGSYTRRVYLEFENWPPENDSTASLVTAFHEHCNKYRCSISHPTKISFSPYAQNSGLLLVTVDEGRQLLAPANLLLRK